MRCGIVLLLLPRFGKFVLHTSLIRPCRTSCVGAPSPKGKAFLQLSADLFGSLGQQDPFCLLHDSALQYFRSIAVLDIDGLLGDDLTAVGDLIDEVDRSTGDLNAVFQCLFVYSQSVEIRDAIPVVIEKAKKLKEEN